MANQQYIKVKIAAVETEIKTKQAQVKELRARLASYKEQLGDEPPAQPAAPAE